MKIFNSSYVAGFLFSISATSAFVSAIEALNPRSPCAKSVHIIGTRGDSTKPPEPYGGLQTMVNGIKREIPGSTNSSTPYPKHVPATVKIGELRLRRSIKQYAAQCPNTPIILVGYSKGAVIVLNAICGDYIDGGKRAEPLDPKYRKQIIAINLYGDDSRVPDQPYNRGTCQTFGSTPRTNSDQCQPYASVIRSWCDSPDSICCTGGTNETVHSTYPTTYDKVAINFAVNRYHKFRKD